MRYFLGACLFTLVAVIAGWFFSARAYHHQQELFNADRRTLTESRNKAEAERASAERKVAALESQLKASTKAGAELAADRDSLLTRCNSLVRECDELKGKLARTAQAFASRSDELRGVIAEKGHLEEVNQELVLKLHNMTQETLLITKERDSLADELTRQTVTVRDLTNAYTSKLLEVQKMIEEVRTAKAQADDNAKAARELADEAKKASSLLAKDIDALRSRVVTIRVGHSGHVLTKRFHITTTGHLGSVVFSRDNCDGEDFRMDGDDPPDYMDWYIE